MGTRFVTDDNVWPELRELAAATRGPRQVATAYLGDGAGNRLGLRGGDTLVVALTVGNAKSGSVSPVEVRKLIRRGVGVYVNEQLHAKVYLFDDVVAVGSPNLSRRSETTLHEALLISDDQVAIQQARAWFEELRAAPVTPDRLEHCLSVYTPPRVSTTRESRANAEGRLWLVGVRETDFPEHEDQARAKGKALADEEVDAGYQTETLRFASKSLFTREVKRGDFVIQVWEEGRARRVYPHARVVRVLRTKSRRGADVLYVYLETREDSEPSSWAKFRREMKAVRPTLGESVTTRELRGHGVTKRAKWLTQYR